MYTHCPTYYDSVYIFNYNTKVKCVCWSCDKNDNSLHILNKVKFNIIYKTRLKF